ncbi:exosome 3'-_5 exonuclease subunit ski4 (Csl4) [Coniochaeta pulveracea]|uniref:Exosome 3'->5 exonuclease subunit ski4 (Csl4) n=1 Tax=Coniochaeta pulveracea TaxID=177199 RepID=A0A420Y1X0_9PEZI|nr:exosome 3'->5 exonuclease subunit ski4 (Csl4) [Coniochaeta pulveracea]
MSSTTQSIAIPGQLLGPASKYTPGLGTHIHEANLYSSLLGVVHISQTKPQGPAKRLTKITAAPPVELPTISVSRSGDSEKREVLPGVNDIVLSRVIRITPRQAVVSILVCGDSVLEAEWQGVIRVQDVRATEKDRVKIYESFRPGDIVRAEVISLGDQANYYLSTARNELGVIMATSEAGNTMYPVSWKEYKDPETGVVEKRKVAKPY